ncbi:putative U-box domain-containing protein 50 isoform X1 [Diospyros lotus]|uniref:putative U-box domain-containing protein 50 isoform X1 n=1 Tax=Diospyros lotus TaxID=55363 RepID=UPI00224D9928|nr:putative U-box domain-containing protein 50 isoform X1 [Diospyros lotus]
MDSQEDRVCVAVGNDPQDGFATLAWALGKWSSHSISIVILHVPNNYSPKDYVYTPFGKLPARYISDEKLQIMRKMKEVEDDKLLSRYKGFCGKVKTEILKIEKHDQPLHKVLLDLILELRITKLVMGISIMKSSSGKCRSAISGSFYVHQYKPEFCELFIVCGGKLVFLRGATNEGFTEGDQGVMATKLKEKGSFNGWLGKLLPESATNERNLGSSRVASMNNDSTDQWEYQEKELESYFYELLSSNCGEKCPEMECDTLWNGQAEPDMPSGSDKIELLKIGIRKAQDVIQLKKRESKENAARRARAEWASCLCKHRAEELEASIGEEIAARADLKKELDTVKEEVSEVRSEVEDKKRKLKPMLELQHELSNKLQLSSLAKSHAEGQLEKAVTERANILRDIEELRRQRDVLRRRIEFCREKDAIGMATRLSDLGFNYKEFAAEEIRAATDNFSDRLRLKSACGWTNVYKGRINHTAVAIKLHKSVKGSSQEAFQAKVKVLSQMRHPHLVAMMGFCSELQCVVFEYMQNGCLRDALFLVGRSSKRRNRGLNWHTRVHIAAEVCSGLSFLHSARPKPVSHGNLNPSKILLDCNLVAKIHCFRPGWCHNQFNMQSDIQAFGTLVLQLLAARNWEELPKETIPMDRAAVQEVLDDSAGEWPLDVAVELAGIAMRCLSANKGPGTDVSMTTVMKEIDKVMKKANDLVARGGREEATNRCVDTEDLCDVPGVFLCPIFQDVMKNPHIAADGFSYELEAIQEWLRTGGDTSPMTNLKLKHKQLTPNHTLRSLIQDWSNKRSIILA